MCGIPFCVVAAGEICVGKHSSKRVRALTNGLSFIDTATVLRKFTLSMPFGTSFHRDLLLNQCAGVLGL